MLKKLDETRSLDTNVDIFACPGPCEDKVKTPAFTREKLVKRLGEIQAITGSSHPGWSTCLCGGYGGKRRCGLDWKMAYELITELEALKTLEGIVGPTARRSKADWRLFESLIPEHSKLAAETSHFEKGADVVNLNSKR